MPQRQIVATTKKGHGLKYDNKKVSAQFNPVYVLAFDSTHLLTSMITESTTTFSAQLSGTGTFTFVRSFAPSRVSIHTFVGLFESTSTFHHSSSAE
jgi:hypothetical protein